MTEKQPEPATVADLLDDIIAAEVPIERPVAVRLINRIRFRYTITHKPEGSDHG